jgi:TctA family transporter
MLFVVSPQIALKVFYSSKHVITYTQDIYRNTTSSTRKEMINITIYLWMTIWVVCMMHKITVLLASDWIGVSMFGSNRPILMGVLLI